MILDKIKIILFSNNKVVSARIRKTPKTEHKQKQRDPTVFFMNDITTQGPLARGNSNPRTWAVGPQFGDKKGLQVNLESIQ